jgi:CHAD domain-containing protein
MSSQLARESLARSLNQSWVRYELLRVRCEQDPRRGAVHDFRIEIRRLLAALDLLNVLAPECKAVCKLRGSVKRELELVRELRDYQVQEKRAKGEEGLRSFAKRVKARRKKLKRLIRRRLSPGKFLKSQQRFVRVEKAVWDAHTDDAPLLFEAIARAYREVERRASEVDEDDFSSVHRLRIAFRKYRYACEALEELHPIDERSSDRADDFQKTLGDLQDNVVLLGMLKKKERSFEPGLKDETCRLVADVLKKRNAAVRALRPRHRVK